MQLQLKAQSISNILKSAGNNFANIILITTLTGALYLAITYLFFVTTEIWLYNSLEEQKNSNFNFDNNKWLAASANKNQNLRIQMYNDLIKNHLSDNYKFADLERLLGSPTKKIQYNRFLYKQNCNQYYLASKSRGLSTASMYMIVCPDKNEEYIAEIYTIPRYNFWYNFDFGREIEI